MTMHSAKGLEFPNVFVVGMEEGVFPGSRVIGEGEEMEEERRLCYVAMTRARERLVMTAARQRMLYGRTNSNPPSRFLEELPREPVEWENNPPVPAAAGGESGFDIRARMAAAGTASRLYPRPRRRPGKRPAAAPEGGRHPPPHLWQRHGFIRTAYGQRRAGGGRL